MAGEPGSDLISPATPAPAARGLPPLDRPRPPATARRLLRRLVVAVAGFAVVVLGLVLVPLPGPGWAIVFSGVALLSTEFTWAERLLHAVGRRLAPVTAALARVPRVVRRAVVGLGIALAIGSVAVSLVVLAR